MPELLTNPKASQEATLTQPCSLRLQSTRSRVVTPHVKNQYKPSYCNTASEDLPATTNSVTSLAPTIQPYLTNKLPEMLCALLMLGTPANMPGASPSYPTDHVNSAQANVPKLHRTRHQKTQCTTAPRTLQPHSRAATQPCQHPAVIVTQPHPLPPTGRQPVTAQHRQQRRSRPPLPHMERVPSPCNKPRTPTQPASHQSRPRAESRAAHATSPSRGCAISCVTTTCCSSSSTTSPAAALMASTSSRVANRPLMRGRTSAYAFRDA